MTVQEMGRACMEHALFKRGAGGGKKIAGTAADEQTIKHLLESSAYDFFRRGSFDHGCDGSIAHNCTKTHEKRSSSAIMQRCCTFNSEGQLARDGRERTTKQRFRIGRQLLGYDLQSDA
jgi:hypothetical protein